jgi:hypothetical protein
MIDLLRLDDMSETPVEVIAHPDVWVPKFWRSGKRYRYVGILSLVNGRKAWGPPFT